MVAGEIPSPEPLDVADSAVVRACWDDVLERDGQLLVLVGNDVMLLSPLASAAALACEHGITVAALAEALVAQFGTPPDVDQAHAVRELLATLLGRRVLGIDGETSPDRV